MNAFEQYKQFLSALFKPTDVVCFAAIQDGEEPLHSFMAAQDAMTEGRFKILSDANDTHSIYIAMNSFRSEMIGQKKGRKKENVAEIKRLYIDADKDGEVALDNVSFSSVVPKPNVTLETSPGKFQFIWNVGELTKETAEPLLKALAQEFGTDPKVAEIARVLRIPGLRNRKYPDAPEVKVVGEIDSQVYKLSDFKVKFNPVESKPEIARDENNLVQVGHIHHFMLAVAGKLRESGLTPDEIEPVLRRRVHEECQTPPNGFDDSKIVAMARSMASYEKGRNTDLLLTQTPQPQPIQPPEDPKKAITTVNGDAFLIENIPPRKVLISTISTNEPVIFEQSINQVFAWRGEGKTCLGLGFVRTLATGGSFLNFKATERNYVLYVEGELPDSQFQERWRSIVGQTDGYAFMASIDKQPDHHYVSLASEIGMAKIEATLAELESKGIKVKVLMLDNISTLFNVKANEEEVWIGIQSWFTSLRSRGITVFFYHHAGKAGLSRSHSKSEDMLDVSIKLEAPEDPEQGHLHTILTFDKARAGLSEKPAEIKLHRTHSPKCRCGGVQQGILFCPGDGVRWEHIPKTDKKPEAFRMFAEGLPPATVSDLLGVALGTVKMWRTNWGKTQPYQDPRRVMVEAVQNKAKS